MTKQLALVRPRDFTSFALDLKRARKDLAACRHIDDAREIRDKAKAVASYLRACGDARESMLDAAEIAVRAERRLGELVDHLPKAKGTRAAGRDIGGPKMRPPNATPTLAWHGIDKRDAAMWRKLTRLSADEFDRLIAELRASGNRLSANALHEIIKQREHAASRQARADEARARAQPAIVRCQDAREFIAELAPGSVDLLLTDPPYSTDVDDLDAFVTWLPPALERLKPTGRAYICIGAYPLELLTYLQVLRDVGWIERSQVLVWTYRNTLGPSPACDYKLNWQAILHLRGPNARALDCPDLVEQFSVHDLNAPDGRLGDRYHAWQKPDALADRLIRHATKLGELVVDPFVGTGTFVLAAAKLGRSAIGVDRDNATLNIAAQRGCTMEVSRERRRA